MRKMTLASTLLLALVMTFAIGCKEDSHASHSHDDHDHAGHDHAHDHAKAAASKSTAAAKDSAAQAGQAAQNIKFINVMCPVSDEKVNPASKHMVTVEHQGVTYGLCCEDCVEPFKKDPAKYIAKLTTPAEAGAGTTPAMPAMP